MSKLEVITARKLYLYYKLTVYMFACATVMLTIRLSPPLIGAVLILILIPNSYQK